ELVAEAFEGYWRKKPSVKRLVFKVMPDDTTRAAALKKGEVDVVFQLTGPIAQDIRRTPSLRIVSARTFGVIWLDFPDQWDPKSPWHDKRVRHAASLAIDREAVNQAESLGLSRPTGSIIPRSFEFALPLDPPAYDPGKAKHLLAEAGFPSGFASGVLAEIEELFRRQAREIDRTKREALLHQIQRIVYARAMYAPVFELGPMAGVGPRVDQAGVGLISGYPYSAPYEDVKLKKS